MRRAPARAWLVLLPFLVAADGAWHRFRRPIEGAQGWTEVDLPDDVLDAARPGLADVRVLSPAGEEIPYIVGGPLAASPVKVPLFDFEKTDKETTALADRGASAPRADVVELEVNDREFIKPVTLEASTDRAAWRQIAHGSIFATDAGARMLRLHFAPNDRRYWRFRFDDRNGPPIQVTQVITGRSPERGSPPRVVALDLKPEADANLPASTYTASLPSKNLPLSALRLGATDAAFVRRVRVFERVWFRDEVSRRLLGEGEIVRAAGGEEQLGIALSEPTGKHLEIEVERSGGVPLHGVTAEVVALPCALRFHAPQDSIAELVYGSNASAPPAYDLAAALRGGLPASFAKAKLGPVADNGAEAPALPAVARGIAIETAGWKIEQPIVLPAGGLVAYLDLDRGAGPLQDIRIIDQNRRQIPYIVETEPRHTRVPLAFRAESASGATRLHLDGIDRENAPIESIELEITSPDYFERDVQIEEQLFDARGKTETRSLGNAHFVKTADRPARAFRVPIAQPSRPELIIQITDGDNAPLVVAGVSAEKSRRRLNFVFAAGDELRLLTGNAAASAPRYDLALVAAKVLSSPAEPATLGQVRSIAPEAKPTPAWFWIFVLAAALILMLALGRTLARPLDK